MKSTTIIFLCLILAAGSNAETVVPKSSQIDDLQAQLLLAQTADPSTAAKIYIQLLQNKNLTPTERATITAQQGANALRLGYFVQAKTIYQQALALDPTNQAIDHDYANAAMAWGDFYLAEKIIRHELQREPSYELKHELAAILRAGQRYEEAEGIYYELLYRQPNDGRTRLALARLQIAEKDFPAALSNARCAAQSLTTNKEAALIIATAQHYLNPTSTPQDFVYANAENFTTANAAEHAEAQQLAQNGEYLKALALNKEILERDPNYFPAALSQAELYAASRQYKEALNCYKSLLTNFPTASKLLIDYARVLSWDRQYQAALDLYEKIAAMNPRDPLPKKEMARVALWAKQWRRGFSTYDELLAQAVDIQLLASCPSNACPSLKKELAHSHQDPPYQGYEKLLWQGTNLPPQMRELMLNYWGTYRLQKAIYLEKKAKYLSWRRYPGQAGSYYSRLIQTVPGNQEAFFDYAQLACQQGLNDVAIEQYEKLLKIDPLHSRAQTALAAEKLKKHPLAVGRYNYWRESGRGDISQLTRNDFRLGAAIPFLSRNTLGLYANQWYEQPHWTNGWFDASGFNAELLSIFNPYWQFRGNFTRKIYTTSGPKDLSSGDATLQASLYNYVQLGFTYRRSDEVQNYFGMLQGIQADNWRLSADSAVYNGISFNGLAEWKEYTDDNRGEYYFLQGSCEVTDHPRVLKLGANVEYRDTEHKSPTEHFGTLPPGQQPIHPYWTPINYTAGGILINWYHDISKEYGCGERRHYYELKVLLRYDTEENPSLQPEMAWHFDITRRWTINLAGYVVISELWNGQSLNGSLSYRF